MLGHRSPTLQSRASRTRRHAVLGSALAGLLVALTALGACGSDDEPATEANSHGPAGVPRVRT